MKKFRYLSANVSSTGSLSSIEICSEKKNYVNKCFSLWLCNQHSKLIGGEGVNTVQEKHQWLNDGGV